MDYGSVDYGYFGPCGLCGIQWIMGTLDHVDCVHYGYREIWIPWIMDTVDYGYFGPCGLCGLWVLWIMWIDTMHYGLRECKHLHTSM